ncbi:MAG: hypothetical protein AAB270_03525 [Chloroflexota bacterium]
MAERKKPAPSPDGAETPEDFYSGVLTQADSLLMDRARRLEGLDEEVALLRVKLREALARCPEDYSLLLKLSAMLVRAASARYRLSTKAEEDLYQSVLGVLKGVGGVLFPEGREGSDAPA